MALGDYTKTVYVNGGTPAINDTNLNNVEDKIEEIDTAMLTVTNMTDETTATVYKLVMIDGLLYLREVV